jgi:phosphate transport system permease protein
MTTRKLMDRAFTLSACFAVALMTLFLLFVLLPILGKGAGAYLFWGTVEHRRMMLDQFGRGNEERVSAEWAEAQRARRPIYEAVAAFEKELPTLPAARRKALKPAFKDVREGLAVLLGPEPGAPAPALTRGLYGQTRWDRAQEKIADVLYEETWDYASGEGKRVLIPRQPQFRAPRWPRFFRSCSAS